MSRGGGGARGKSGTLTQEQLQALGIIGKDLPAVTTTPPPTFPPLMTKPISSEISSAQNFKILWKEDFLNYMRDSAYFQMPKHVNKNFERYSGQYDFSLVDENSMKAKNKLEFPLPLLPLELRLNEKRKRLPKMKNNQEFIKKMKVKSVEEHLIKLEQKEKTDENKVGNSEIEKSDSDAEDEEQEIEIEDDEMDEDNDYGNNYFDNGEAFNEEDDNLDDGPIY